MKRNLAIQILCPLFLLIGAGNICQAQELEGKFRIHCAVFVLFSSSEWQETEKGKLIESYAFPAPTVEEGDDMADGLLYDAEGESHHLSELQGRYILLDFWSIYCGPCRMSEPEMEEIAHLYGDKLALVGISNDEKTSWSKFLKEHKMPGYQWKEPKNGGRSLASRYKAGGIPHFVLISPEGIIKPEASRISY